MNSKSKEELVEQYEDAAFELLMSEYAEQEGNRLLREFEEAKARGEVPEIPAALDARCRRMIRHAYEKERRKERMHKAIKTMTRTVAVLFVTLGVCTTLVVSVEALRTPFVNFLLDNQEYFSSIDFDNEEASDPTQIGVKDQTEDTEGAVSLDQLMPTGYTLIRYVPKDDGSMVVIYENGTGNMIFLATTVMKGDINLDTEDADSEPICIGGYEGFFIRKDGELKITWFNGENQLAYQLKTDGLSNTDFWVLAEEIAKAEIGG